MLRLLFASIVLFFWVLTIQYHFDLDLNDAGSYMRYFFEHIGLGNYLLTYYDSSPILTLLYYMLSFLTKDTIELYYITNSLIIAYGSLIFSLICFKVSNKLIASFFVLLLFLANPFVAFHPILINMLGFSILCTFILASLYIKNNLYKWILILIGSTFAFFAHPIYLTQIAVSIPFVIWYLFEKFVKIDSKHRTKIFLLFNIFTLTMMSLVFFLKLESKISRSRNVFKKTAFNQYRNYLFDNSVFVDELSQEKGWNTLYKSSKSIGEAFLNNPRFFVFQIYYTAQEIIGILISYFTSLHYFFFSFFFLLSILMALSYYLINRKHISFNAPSLPTSEPLIICSIISIGEISSSLIYGATHRSLVGTYACLIFLLVNFIWERFKIPQLKYQHVSIFFLLVMFMAIRPVIFKPEYGKTYELLQDGYYGRLKKYRLNIVRTILIISKKHKLTVLTSDTFKHIQGYTWGKVKTISAKRLYKKHESYIYDVKNDLQNAKIIAINDNNLKLLKSYNLDPLNSLDYIKVSGFFENENALIHKSIYQDFMDIRKIIK